MFKHGYAAGDRAKEYRSFMALRNRCNNPKAVGYENYGGRGIRCEYASFEEFLADVGECPGAAHSIDRIDNNGNYKPGNCRWATRREQSENKRNNTFLTIKGRTQTIAQWARETGLPRLVIRKRKIDLGWSDEDCIKPVMEPRKWGVSFYKKYNKWLAYRTTQKQRHIGYFDSKEEAEQACLMLFQEMTAEVGASQTLFAYKHEWFETEVDFHLTV